MERQLSEDEGTFFHISEDLVQSAEIKAAGTSVADFDGLLAKPLRLHEDLANGCGGQLWPAGMVLAKYMLRRPRDFLKDKSMFVHQHQAMVHVI
jgi:protein N-lysine methyltransferase METTL21A